MSLVGSNSMVSKPRHPDGFEPDGFEGGGDEPEVVRWIRFLWIRTRWFRNVGQQWIRNLSLALQIESIITRAYELGLT
jgi:hypothetical protein